MTLGRTSSGAIKIKTDEAGGGLRAVNCACCGGCGCYNVTIPEDLLETLQNINSATCNGMPPDFENNEPGYYYAVWDFGIEGRFISYGVQVSGTCLSISGQTLSYSSFEFDGFRYIGPIDGCCPSDKSCSPSGDILVNGVAIPSYLAGAEFPIYEFVFS